MNKNKTSDQKSEAYFQTVEAGDIALFEPFGETIAMFGYTKAGKTSSCHIMANSPLKADKLNGELVYRTASQKFNTAIIGNSSESETEIPNIFEGKFKDSKGTFKTVTILDQPGYGDSYGFHRIFSNGYFHYRTFSKTPKLKFILAIKKDGLDGTGQLFKNTLFNFISTFTNYAKIKNQILNATVILITQADPKTSVENITSKIVKLRDGSISNLSDQEKNIFQEVINHMISSKSIFLIQKPEQANSQTRETDLLMQIYEKTTFWQRNLKGKIVDMSQINFSVADEILAHLISNAQGNQLFKQDFSSFIDYMNKRINSILVQHQYSLKKIFDKLKYDAVINVESHTFLQEMKEFNKSFYKFSEKFREKREKTESTLFNINELKEEAKEQKLVLISNESATLQRMLRQKQMKSVYFIKKFRVLEFIKNNAKEQANKMADVVRNISWLEEISNFFNEIFKQFNILRIQRSDSEKIIFKYSYVVQRLIEQSKIITLILFSNPDARKRFDDIKVAMVDIFRPLLDVLFVQFQEFDLASLKQKFTQRLDFSTLEVVNKEIITFFESVPDNDNRMPYKIAKLLLKYAQIVETKKMTMSSEEKRFVALKLYQLRNKFYLCHLNTLKESGSRAEHNEIIDTIFRLTNALGNLLCGMNLYKQARGVYQSISNASLIFKIFEEELKIVENRIADCRKLYIQYGNSAGYYHRKELAMRCYQQAYARSETYDEFHKVSEAIITLETVGKEKEDPYLKKFKNQEFCQDLPKYLQAITGYGM